MSASELYPLSTQDGKAVPLDVVRPLALVSWAFTLNTPIDITIPAGFGLVWVIATEPCVLRFSATNLPAGLVAGTEYANSIYIPADTLISLMATPGEASLLGLASGSLYMNSVEQWSALLQSTQATTG